MLFQAPPRSYGSSYGSNYGSNYGSSYDGPGPYSKIYQLLHGVAMAAGIIAASSTVMFAIAFLIPLFFILKSILVFTFQIINKEAQII